MAGDKSPPLGLVARPHKWLAAITSVLGALVIAAAYYIWRTARPDEQAGTGVLCLVLLGIACITVVAIWRVTLQTLEVGPEGLTFRKRFTPWSDIVDWGWRTSEKYGRGTVLITTQEGIWLNPVLWHARTQEQIAEAIAKYAPHLPQAGELGLRPEDRAPQVFAISRQLPWLIGFLWYGLAGLLGIFLWGVAKLALRGETAGWEWGGLAMYGVVLALKALLVGMTLRSLQEQSQLKRLTVNQEILVVERQDGLVISVPWSEVSALRYELMGWRVVAGQGEFVFGNTLPSYQVLITLIRDRASIGREGEDTAVPQVDSRGTRIWRYDSTYRTLLWIPLAIGGFGLAQPYLVRVLGFEGTPKGGDPAPFFLAILLLALWGWWRNWVSLVRAPWKKRFIQRYTEIMKRTTLSIMALALALPVLAQKPEEILQKYITASGGTAAYAKVKSQVQKGTISMPAQGITGNFTMSYKAPAKMAMSATLPGVGEIGQGYDGKVGWSRDPFMGTRTLKGNELAQILNELTLSNDPVSYKKVFSKIEVLPPGKVGKLKALRLKLTPKAGTPQTLYFDATSYLLLRRDATIASPQGNVPSETYFTDYRSIDGVKIPFKTRTVAGPAEQIITVTDVKNNIPVDDKIFAKPASEPAGKTKM